MQTVNLAIQLLVDILNIYTAVLMSILKSTVIVMHMVLGILLRIQTFNTIQLMVGLKHGILKGQMEHHQYQVLGHPHLDTDGF